MDFHFSFRQIQRVRLIEIVEQYATIRYSASSSIVVDISLELICRTFNSEAPRQRETLSSILRRVPRPVTTFTLSPPFHIYLGLLHYGHFERSSFPVSSFLPGIFRLGLRLSFSEHERMAVRWLLGSPPAQIAFARVHNLWAAMIKSRGIVIECLSRRFRWKCSPMRRRRL